MNQEQISKKYIKEGSPVTIHSNLIFYEIGTSDMVNVCTELYHHHNLPIKTITAIDEREENNSFKIIYVFGIPRDNFFLLPFLQLKNTREFPSLVKVIHEASGYERKIKTFFGLNPEGHPDPRPILLHENWAENIFPLRRDFNWQTRPQEGKGKYCFRKVEGEGIYEIPVGPVHAGIIEPGHFRFSVAGEEIIFLEPRLGYTHKGSEKLFEVLPMQEKIRLSERISGDSSFSHSLAFCQAVESLGEIKVSDHSSYLRVIYSELERIANHLGDIGAIMTDTGFSFGGANGARLREIIMQWNERLTGSRFLRGVNTISGVLKGISSDTKKELLKELAIIEKDFSEVIEVAQNSNSLLNRLKNTGTLNLQIARDHGVIGVAGRALGMQVDARVDYPYAAYDKIDFSMAQEKTGDVYARFSVRIEEVFSSFKIIARALQNIPHEERVPVNSKPVILKKNSYAIGMVEGWRGDIVYFVATDSEGQIKRIDVRDPSFLNWTVLGYAGQGNVVPDFPLINKSFNLSYSGNDL